MVVVVGVVVVIGIALNNIYDDGSNHRRSKLCPFSGHCIKYVNVCVCIARERVVHRCECKFIRTRALRAVPLVVARAAAASPRLVCLMSNSISR